jgi:hypothetical protein
LFPKTSTAIAVFFWIFALAAASIAAWFGALLVARVVKQRLSTEDSPQPFTLQGLRELRAQSAITEAEFQSMRAAILGHYASPTPDEPTRDPETHGHASDDGGATV